MHREEQERGHAHEQRVGIQQAEECAGEFMIRVERDAAHDVAHRHTDEECREGAAEGEKNVPHFSPPRPRFLAAELDGDGAERSVRRAAA